MKARAYFLFMLIFVSAVHSLCAETLSQALQMVLEARSTNPQPPGTPISKQGFENCTDAPLSTPPQTPSSIEQMRFFFASLSPFTPRRVRAAHSAPTSPRSGVHPPGGSDGAPRRQRSSSISLPPRHPVKQLTTAGTDSPATHDQLTPLLQTPPSNREERLKRARARKLAALAAKRERELSEAEERKSRERERMDMQYTEWEAREHEAECSREQQERFEQERIQAQKKKLQAQLAQPTTQAIVHYRKEQRKGGNTIYHTQLPVWRLVSADRGVDLPHEVAYITRLPNGRLVPVEHDALKNGYYLPDPLPTKPLTKEEEAKQLELVDAVELQPIECRHASPRKAFGGGVLSSAGGAALIYALTQYVQAFKSHRRFRQVGKRMQQHQAVKKGVSLSPEQMKALVKSFYLDTQKMRSTRNKQLLRALFATVFGSGALIGGVKMARATKPLGATKYSWTDRHDDCPGYIKPEKMTPVED